MGPHVIFKLDREWIQLYAGFEAGSAISICSKKPMRFKTATTTSTTAPGIILVINKAKKHLGEILLINASKLFTKGRPKNYLADDHIKQVCEIYRDWREEEGLGKIIRIEEAAHNDYNLSPSRYVSTNGKEEYRPVEEILVELIEVEEERQAVDKELNEILAKLGFGGWLNG